MTTIKTGWSADTLQNFNGGSEEWNLASQHRRLARTIEVMRAERIRTPLIEFGALAGGFADWYCRELGLPHGEVVCSDFAPVQLARAAERGFRTVCWDLASGMVPEAVRGERFSTVLFCEIIEHLPNPEVPLRAIADALAPGGKLIVSTPNLASLGNRIRLLMGRTPSCAPGPGLSVKAKGSLASGEHLRVCVPGEWVALLESVGLKVIRVTGCTSGPEHPVNARQRLSLALNQWLEDKPGALFMNTLIVAQKP